MSGRPRGGWSVLSPTFFGLKVHVNRSPKCVLLQLQDNTFVIRPSSAIVEGVYLRNVLLIIQRTARRNEVCVAQHFDSGHHVRGVDYVRVHVVKSGRILLWKGTRERGEGVGGIYLTERPLVDILNQSNTGADFVEFHWSANCCRGHELNLDPGQASLSDSAVQLQGPKAKPNILTPLHCH